MRDGEVVGLLRGLEDDVAARPEGAGVAQTKAIEDGAELGALDTTAADVDAPQEGRVADSRS